MNLASLRSRSTFQTILLSAVLISNALAAQEPAIERLVVSPRVDSCLKLRAEPNSESDPVDCLARGTTVDRASQQGEWSAVSLPDGRTGWMASRFLERAEYRAAAGISSITFWLNLNGGFGRFNSASGNVGAKLHFAPVAPGSSLNWEYGTLTGIVHY